jgi:putative ABC transport system substrate-binding protein
MSGDAEWAERFLTALFATVVKPISDLRRLISGLFALLFALCLPAEAQQQAKIAKIGVLRAQPASSPAASHELLLRALRELGYVEGKSIVFETRAAEGKLDRFPALVDELVRLKVDVLVASSTSAALAAKNAARTIPIVFLNVSDPVASGLVDSLARPGKHHGDRQH